MIENTRLYATVLLVISDSTRNAVGALLEFLKVFLICMIFFFLKGIVHPKIKFYHHLSSWYSKPDYNCSVEQKKKIF